MFFIWTGVGTHVSFQISDDYLLDHLISFELLNVFSGLLSSLETVSGLPVLLRFSAVVNIGSDK